MSPVRPLALAALGAALAIAVPSSARPTGPRAPVRTHSSKDRLARWLDLERNPETALSVRVPGLRPGDEVLVRAELGVTNDLATRSAQRGSSTYKGEHRYPLRVLGELALAAGGAPRGGRRLDGGGDERVSPQNHHGSLVVRGRGTVGGGDGNADQVNLVVRSEVPGVANPPRDQAARSYDGFVRPPGMRCMTRVDNGGLDVLVLERGWDATWRRTTEKTKPGDVKVNAVRPRTPRVAISVPLGRVKEGEVFDVHARLEVVSRNATPQLLSGRLVLGDSPSDIKGPPVTPQHGHNVPARARDALHKVASFTARRDHAQLWLNLVSTSNGDSDDPGRQLDVVRGDSWVEVTRYSPR